MANINCWASVLDNGASATPQVQVEIWATTLSEGSTSQVTPTSVISGISDATGDSNNRFYVIKNTSAGSDVTQSQILFPVFKLVFEEEPEEKNFDVWITGSFRGYWSS